MYPDDRLDCSDMNHATNDTLLRENEKLKNLLRDGLDAWYGDAGWELFQRWVISVEQALKGK